MTTGRINQVTIVLFLFRLQDSRFVVLSKHKFFENSSASSPFFVRGPTRRLCLFFSFGSLRLPTKNKAKDLQVLGVFTRKA